MYDRETWRESLTALLTNLNLNVYPDTIATELKSWGFRHRIERKRPYLSKKQKEARLTFVKKYIYWTAEEWRRYI
jgi:Transposase